MYTKDEIPIFTQIRPFYQVIDNGISKNYATLIDISHYYKTSISNIYHLVEGKKVKSLNIEIIKEQTPYVFQYKDIEYKCKTIKDISKITDGSVTYIHSIIKKYILGN